MAWRMLRRHPMHVIATWLALFLGVIVVTTCGVLLESGIRYHGTVARYAAAPVLVATSQLVTTDGSGEDRDIQGHPLAQPGPLNPGLRSAIAAAPGVRRAVVDIGVPAALRRGHARLAIQVHPWSAAQLAPYRMVAGAPPSAPGQIVLDRTVANQLGAGPGSGVQLDVATGPRAVTVSGVATAGAAGAGAGTVIAPSATVRRLPGAAADVIGVFQDPGVSTDELAGSVTSVLPDRPTDPSGAYPQVYSGADRGLVESLRSGADKELVIAISSVFGGCALLIAVLVIAGTIGLAIAQRHRDIALLRAVAATPRQIRRMVVRENLAVGMTAAALGVWPGIVGASWLRGQFVGRGFVGDTFRVDVSWLPPLVASAAVLLIAGSGAWIAGLRASRIRPVDALGESIVERRGIGVVRTALGLVALAGGITLSSVASSATGDSAAGISVATVFTLVTAAALLSPLLIRLAAGVLGPLLRRFGVPGRLAAANTSTAARRLSAVLGSLVLAVGLGGSLWFVQSSQLHASAAQTSAGLLADHVVVGAAPGVDAATVHAVRIAPGVAAVTRVVHSTIYAGSGDPEGETAQGIDVAALRRTLDLDVTEGSLARLHGDTVAVDALTAARLELHVGSVFSGWYADGSPADLTVVAVYQRGLGFAQFTLQHDVLARHSSGFDDALLVSARDPNAVAGVRRALARTAPGTRLVARAAYRTSLSDNMTQSAWTNQVVTAVLLGYVVIAAANSLAMYALARRREFATLRLAGTTRRQILRMVHAEQILLLGLALFTGGAIAAATLLPMVKGITGRAVPYIPWQGWLAVIGGVVLLGVLATTVPVRRVLRSQRTNPVADIGVRE
jgi:putative ABC transport system permease protein